MKVLRAIFGGRYSLKRNLVLNIILALCFCIGLAMTVLTREFYEHLEENLVDALITEAWEIANQVQPNAPHYGFDPNLLRFRGDTGLYRYTLFDQTAQVVVGAETSPAIQAQLVAMAIDAPTRISLTQNRIGVAVKTTTNGAAIYALASLYPAGVEQSDFKKLAHEVQEEIWWVVLGVIAILVAAILAARRSLIPLMAVSKQASVIGPKAAGQRLKSDRLPSEIAPLIDAVNGAFDRLEQGYKLQRDFSSNVAHEIRTPLAVLQSSVDTIEDPDLRASLTQDVQRLDQMFEQLINLSRADATNANSFNDIDLQALTVDLAGRMAPGAVRDGQSLAISGQCVTPVRGNAALLEIALGNLVRNALIYSPRGTEIEIEITENPAGWRVMDRGPGVKDSHKLLLFERFNRGGLAENRPDGSGIGLAIVKSVAQTHDARLAINDRPGGGSVFIFEFDASPQQTR
ncbi:MAG: signal transduction histidine kinase [Paracoccaceae bacterium]|jgi:signal transduction histidine kinase